MNRRNFLGLFGAGVAGIAIEQAIPFGRVWSFPKEIVRIGSIIQFRMPQRYLVSRYLGNHLYEVERADVLYNFGKLFPDDVMPDVIIPTAAFLPDSSPWPS